jgi:hypothetical protein
MYHITTADPESILTSGLNWDQRNFTPNRDFNRPGVYFYDNLGTTRRLFPRSRTHVFRVDTQGLPLTQDGEGGQGAWRSTEPVEPQRLEHIHTYEPNDRVLQPPYEVDPRNGYGVIQRKSDWTFGPA